MFTAIHTADWHLGQSFHGFDRDYEHQQFLNWLLDQLMQHQPNALIVAGDVFDSINPSAVAQRRVYDFLARACMALPALQIVITAGNHDSAARLEAPAGLLQSLRIHVVGSVWRDSDGQTDVQRFLVPLKDHSNNVAAIVLALPYLRPSDVPTLPGAADPYLEGIRELYQRTTAAAVAMNAALPKPAALLAMGHCHVQGAEESRDSERRLLIGGAEALGAQRFEPEVVDPGGDSALDPLIEEFLECGEQDRLHVDGQREQASEEGRDRRQVILQTVVIGQAEAGGILKRPERTARHIATIDAAIKLAQGVAGIGRLEVVLGPEQPLPAGLALTPRDRA